MRMFHRTVAYLAIVAVLLASATFNAVPRAEAQPKAGGSLNFGAFRDAIGFDPHVAGGIHSSWLMGNVYDTLVEYDGEGKIVGALAESWEHPNPRTWVFKLRKGVKYQDGTDLDARDVVASFGRIKDPKTGSVRRETVENMEKIETPDPYTLRITLKNPASTFLHALASNAMYIASAYDIQKRLDFRNKTNGTGPFMLANWEPTRRYVLKKNPNYWKKGLPFLDEIVIMILVDDKARVDALRTGEIDLAEYIPWQEIDGLQRDFQVYRHVNLFNQIRFNQTRPPVDNRKVRQALSYTLNRKEIVDLAWGGKGIVMDGPLQPPGNPYYFRELEGYYKYDPDKARALLKEAGYNSPADVPAFEFAVSVSSISAQPGQVVQQQWQKLGLKVNWKTVDVPTLNRNRAEGTYVVHMDGGGPAWTDPDWLREIFHSTQGAGHATAVKYRDERLDRMLEEGARIADFDRRKKIYLEAEKVILEEAPWLFLLWRPQAEAAGKHVKGYLVVPGGLGSFNTNRFEYLWRDR